LPPSEEPEQEDIELEPAPKESEPARGRINVVDKFTDVAINEIKMAKNVSQLAKSAVESYDNRQQFLKPKYVNDIISRENWYKWIFRIYYNTDQARSSDPKYISYIHVIDNYISFIQLPPEQQQQLIKQQREQQQQKLLSQSPKSQTQQQPAQIKSEKEKDFLSDIFGSGLTTQGSGLITQCPNNVLADVERLEILIGGKRAGNNSREIVNEILDICKRLFTGGIMDINVYQSLIEEIADDYYSD
jgi:hypothetical protein